MKQLFRVYIDPRDVAATEIRMLQGVQEARPMKIDHDCPIPFYIQLRELLEARILEGEWQPGDRLPTEQALCDRYGVSRTVVRQTLQEMQNKGLILKRRGKGSFVAKSKIGESLVQKLTGFHQDMVEQGLTPRTEVLHHEMESAKALSPCI
jgi:GntR family transcriptional regulator